jgi:hypothetical protein
MTKPTPTEIMNQRYLKKVQEFVAPCDLQDIEQLLV